MQVELRCLMPRMSAITRACTQDGCGVRVPMSQPVSVVAVVAFFPVCEGATVTLPPGRGLGRRETVVRGSNRF